MNILRRIFRSPDPVHSVAVPQAVIAPSSVIAAEAALTIPLLFLIGHFYSPIADPVGLRAREAQIWAQIDEMPCINLNVVGQLALLKDLAPYTDDIDWPVDQPKDPPRYFYGNDQFPVLDAEFLYALLRHFKPKAMIEVGSGWSSLITPEVNQSHLGYARSFSCIEPYPRQS